MNRRQFTSQLIAAGIVSKRVLREVSAADTARAKRGEAAAEQSLPANTASLAGPAPEDVVRVPPAYPNARTGGSSGDMYMQNYYLPPPSSTPVYPAWSPSGEEIAFSMHGSIWKIKVGETVAHELTSGVTYDSSPTWSPDGQWIVYTAEEDSKNINLNIVNLATGDTSSLTIGQDLNLDPVWSPDGTRIAYVSTQPDRWFNVFMMPISNGKGREPVQLTMANDFGRDRLYFGRTDLHIEPSWSPDGMEIILISNRGISLGSGGIWRMPAEPNGMTQAKLIHREETLYRTRPDWSPDGTRIVYSSHLGGQFSNLFVLPVVGGEPYKMTFGDWGHFFPRWSPDGTRIAYISNQSGLTDLRILEAFGGKETKIEIRQKVYKRPMGWLDVRVADAQTHQPTAARIYLTANDGKTYTPDDAAHRIDRVGAHLFHTSGDFKVQVPPGPLKLEVVKGFEYQPILKEVDVQSDRVTPLTLSLPRISNLALKGWYSGSEHVHMSYGGTLRTTPEALMDMGAAEDLAIIGDLVANKDNRIFDYQYFRGGLDPHSTRDRLLYFNEEYRPPFLGHMSLINLQTHLISPFTTGYQDTAIGSMCPSNTDILRMVKAEGGIGGYVHPFDKEPSTIDYGRARGLPVDVALGTVDYLEVSSAADDFATSAVWHRLLNCGFRLTAAGGEDSETDLYRSAVEGSSRTYVYLGAKLNWDAWIQALRKGASFVTNGPMLEFTINGHMPGEEIHLPSTGGRVGLRGSMKCIVPVEKVEVLNNGSVVMTAATSEAGRAATFSEPIEVKRSGWYTLRAYTTRPGHPLDARYVFAETSPIYVFCGDRPIRSAEDAAYFVKWIDTISRLAEADAGWRSDKEKQHVLGQFEEARQIYLARGRESG